MQSVYKDPDYTEIGNDLKQVLGRLREYYQVPVDDSL
jgi:hypothetical protein